MTYQLVKPMKNLRLIVQLAVVLIIGASCTKFSKFSQEDYVTNFVVVSYLPQEIQIQDVQIKQDSIIIPISYGKYEFPMKFTAKVAVSDGAEVKGIDFNSQHTFKDINDRIEFFVVAADGTTTRYIIAPKEIPLDEDNYIFKPFDIKGLSPTDAVVLKKGANNENNYGISVVNYDYAQPLSIVPEFIIASQSQFGTISGGVFNEPQPFENGATELIFTEENTTYQIEVISQSGNKRVWNVEINNIPLVNNTPQQNNFRSLGINPAKTSSKIESVSPLCVDRTVVDPDTNEVRVEINTASIDDASKGESKDSRDAPITQPIDVRMNFGFIEYVELIDIKADTLVTFDSYSDTKTFYILDLYENVARMWSIVPVEIKQASADIVEFNFTVTKNALVATSAFGSANTPSVVFPSPLAADIYPNSATVIVKTTSITKEFCSWINNPKKWAVTLSLDLTLPQGATCSNTTVNWASNATAGIGSSNPNSDFNRAETITVTAEDGTTKEWSIILQNPDKGLSADCDITKIAVKSVSPYYVKFEANPAVISGTEIMFNLSYDDDGYPLSITPNYTLSNLATVSPSVLTFDTPESTQQITVTAQDGTTKTYTASLVSPVKAEGADITAIDFSTLTSGYSMIKPATYNALSGTIVLHVEAPWLNSAIEVGYNSITLSDGATIAIPSKGTLLFDKPSSVVTIPVRSEAGSIKNWFISIEYCPQVKNSDLNNWSNNTTPVDWATANNAFSTGTNKIAGSSGAENDFAAKMTTSETQQKTATGTIFLGEFDADNILAGLNDPVILTNFGLGYQYNGTGKLKGMMFDMWYSPGGDDNSDWCSAEVKLIYWNGNGSYIFHGNRPGSGPHPQNTAVAAGGKRQMYGVGNPVTNRGDEVEVIPRASWVKDIFLPVNTEGINFNYFSIGFASSSYGDFFIGVKNSELRVDNVRLIYE